MARRAEISAEMVAMVARRKLLDRLFSENRRLNSAGWQKRLLVPQLGAQHKICCIA